MVVLLALLVALAPSRATNEPDYVATLVGRAFLRAVAERDVDRAANLCGPSVNFDGIEASGRDVRRYLARMTDRLPQGYTFKTVRVLSYHEAVLRFGPPPTRLHTTKQTTAVVVFGRLPKLGLIAILNKQRGRWRVVALTD